MATRKPTPSHAAHAFKLFVDFRIPNPERQLRPVSYKGYTVMSI